MSLSGHDFDVIGKADQTQRTERGSERRTRLYPSGLTVISLVSICTCTQFSNIFFVDLQRWMDLMKVCSVRKVLLVTRIHPSLIQSVCLEFQLVLATNWNFLTDSSLNDSNPTVDNADGPETSPPQLPASDVLTIVPFLANRLQAREANNALLNLANILQGPGINLLPTIANRLQAPDTIDIDGQTREQQTQPQTAVPSLGDGATPETMLSWMETAIDNMISSAASSFLLGMINIW
jgi:hypothetical protein